MSQLSYNLNPAAGRVGMIADDRITPVIVSRLAEGAVPVGKLCQRGTHSMGVPSLTGASDLSTTPGQCKAMAAAAYADPLAVADFLGVPIFDATRPPYDSSDRYEDEDPVPVLKKGEIWVAVLESVTEGDQAWVWGNPGGGDPAVATWAASTHGGLAMKVPGAYWAQSRTGAGLVVLSLDFTP